MKQYFVFELDDGKIVYYDFSTSTCIGKSGKPVKSLNSQLRGISLGDIRNGCTDRNYADFLGFVADNAAISGSYITNLGTVFSRVPRFSRFEQIFSAGIKNVPPDFRYTINDIPKGLRKLCVKHNLRLSNNLLKNYKKYPNVFQVAFDTQYMTLDDIDLRKMLECTWKAYRRDSGYIDYCPTLRVIEQYHYTAKAFFLYLDHLKTYEALDNIIDVISELEDYLCMVSAISNKYDKFPRNFLTTHRIASRNYQRLKKDFDENTFKTRMDTSMERKIEDYRFIYPKSTDEIKDEAVQQHNCVASYIDSVLDGNCHIMFLRKADSPEASLVTLEIRNGKVVQAKQKFNNPISDSQKRVIEQWEKWYENKWKENAV